MFISLSKTELQVNRGRERESKLRVKGEFANVLLPDSNNRSI